MNLTNFDFFLRRKLFSEFWAQKLFGREKDFFEDFRRKLVFRRKDSF